jgi:hypothetical protein
VEDDMNRLTPVLLLPTMLLLVACQQAEQTPPPAPLPNGLLLGLATFESVDGRPVPQPAQLGMLTFADGEWTYRTLSDPDSNVLHKAMVWPAAPGGPGVVTAAGTRAIVRLWRPGADPVTLWEEDFGGKFSRMRDLEIADLYGDGAEALAVATHDQGVVAVVRPDGEGGFTATELDREPKTIVHEVEIGDLDGDGVLEIYATPSLPNKLDGTPQPGQVVRYVPAAGEGRTVVADLGDRHAKEILVGDVDGDGRDELYASVDAVAGGRVRILRYDAGTDPAEGREVTTIADTLCRFLTAGDVDGDGRLEMVAAAAKAGLWLLRPGATPEDRWTVTSIDRDSSGFEHAALLTDLDGDGVDELYVANDGGKEINRYAWDGTGLAKTVLYTHPESFSGFTWNIMPCPVELMP